MQKCLAFDHALTIYRAKKVAPCCVYSGERLDYDSDWKTVFARMGKQSEEGFLPGCTDCIVEDRERGTSWKDHLNEKVLHAQGIVYLDFKLHNTCNLACRMCKPNDSSTWEQIITPEYTDRYYNHNPGGLHKELDIVYDLLNNARYLKFTGGEPFLVKSMFRVLDYCIEKDIAKNINVEVTTNGTTLVHLDKFRKFKTASFLVSVDAVGKRFEYIRPGAKWEQVSQNVLQLATEFDTAITALPMLLNKDHQHELDAWGEQNGITVHWSPPLVDPDFLQVDALEDPVKRERFIKYITLMDKTWNTDYREFVDA